MEYPNGIDIAAWKYLAVVVPIIVFFAPLGSLLSSYFHRQVLAALVYVLDTVALVSSYNLFYYHYYIANLHFFGSYFFYNLQQHESHFNKKPELYHYYLPYKVPICKNF